MNTINELQDEVIEEFNEFTDWMDKYQMLIDLGNDLEPLDEKHKNEQNLIEGCQSRVWLQCDYADGRLVFTADSDALITKGIIALLIRVLSGHTPQEILDAEQPYCFLYVPYALPIVQARFQGIKPALNGIMYNFDRWWVPKDLQRYHVRP